jgi:LmbE family N-acetylglucosaminyl deacetylase
MLTKDDLDQIRGVIRDEVETVEERLNGKINTVDRKVEAVDTKVEAVHAYQKQAHNEIMEHLIESNEINGQAQDVLEKRIERIEKHLGLPPLK